MLRFYSGRSDISQWPGVERPSEYLRGHIAPRVDPAAIRSPFWLVTRRWVPPSIVGFGVAETRRLFDCATEQLAEAEEPPCRRPVHAWNLMRYVPRGDEPAGQHPD